MRKVLLGFGLLAVALVAGLAFSAPRAARAQDEMAKVVCDSDLILSLFTAEYHFDYAVVHEQMMMGASDDMMGVDLAVYEKGQFAPLFDSLMGMMSSGDTMMGSETIQSLVDAMGMDMAAMDSMMMEMMPEGSAEMAALVPPTVEGEAAECTALRDELRHFYTALAYTNMMMMAEGQ
jgi:hypothetical protein